jgi:hypothetical protein
VELVVWINEPASSPRIINPYNPFQYIPTWSSILYINISFFTMDSQDAGTGSLNATISLGGYLNSSLLLAPFNTLNAESNTTIVPTLGFSLIGNVTSTASVTVGDMNQFAVGS